MAATIQTIVKPTRARGLDTSGNNNHAQIYSGRALEFDGVTDYLTGPSTFSHSDTTIALWINQDDATNEYRGIVGRNSSGAGSANWSLWWKEGKPILFIGDTSNAYETITTTVTLESNTWYRLVCTVDFANKTGKIYLNGVLETTVTWTRTHREDSDAILIGTLSDSAEYHWHGKMSNLQVWNSVFSQDDVTYDYLNPEQLALNRGSTSLTNSNLKLWYPMNEGHRGDQSYVLDASNTGIGDDIVNWSSTFNASGTSTSNFGDWTTNANDSTTFCTFDHDNKTVRLRTTDSTHVQAFYVPEILKYGTTYKFEFTVSEITSGSVRVRPQNTTEYLSVSEVGTYSYIVSPEDSTHDLDFRIERHNSEATDVTISDVKIFPINDKHSATTVFFGDELSTTNNNITFSGSGNWAAYNSGAIDVNSAVSGKMQVTVDGGGTAQGAQLTLANMGSSIVAGRTYRVQADLDFISGSDTDLAINFVIGNTGVAVKASDGSPSDGTITTTEETYYADIVAGDATGALRINCTSGTNDSGSNNVFTVDNVSVKEVGIASGWTDADQQLDIPQTALQSYNQLGFSYGAEDTAGGAISCGSITSGSWTTLDIWFFPQESGYNQGLLDQIAWNGDDADSSTGGYGFRVTISSTDKITLSRRVSGTNVTNSMTSTNKINIGEWNHVAVVIPKNDSTSMRMMVNGHYEQTNSSGDHGNTAKDFRLGYGGGINYDSMPGCIAQASYFKEHMSETQMLELYNEGTPIDSRNHSVGTDNLAGYWRNNGVYGNTWTNLANPGTNDGTPQSLITETMLITAGVDSSRDSQGFFMNRQRTTNCINGLPNSEGDDTNIYDSGVVVQDSSTLDITGAFTIGCWFKMKDFDQSYNLIQKKTTWNGAGYGIYIHKDHKKSYLEWAPSSGYKQFGGTNNDVDTLDVWYFFYAVHDPDGLHNSSTGIDSMYIAKTTDTSLTTRTSASMSGGASIDDPVATNDHPLVIGQHSGGGHSDGATVHFTGEIDDVVVYNGALSPEQVLRNFKAGKRSHK